MKQNPIYGERPVVQKVLIVCPVTLINNWRKEFHKWLGNGRVGVFVLDDRRNHLTDFTKGRVYNIMIVGYEKLRTLQENLAKGAGVDIIIADEGHRLKTLQNKSGQAIQSLNASKRVILSGTPIQNDLREFFAAVDLVNPGVLGTFKAFVKEFEGPIVRSRQPEATRKEIEKGESRNEELRGITSMFILRRTADALAKYLPPRTEYVLFCSPTPSQANIYRSVLASPMFQCAIGNSESALQLITILKKLCNSPSLLTKGKGTNSNDNHGEDSSNDTTSTLLASLPPKLLRYFTPSASAKIRVLDQLLHNLHTATSEKVVLVSNYTSTLAILSNLLNSLSLPFLRLDGSTPVQKRQSIVDDFNRLPANKSFAFLLSAKAGGTGINLVGASRLVLFDVDWNPATDLQATARIHRDGQTRHCRIYRILLKGSLEEKIWQRQVTKVGLADSVMGGKSSGGGGGGHKKDNDVAQFSREELKDLFRLDEQSKCQTHELLGCECGGRGRGPGASRLHEDQGISSSSFRARSVNDSDDDPTTNDDDDDDTSFPDIPILIKASELKKTNKEQHDDYDDDEDDDERTSSHLHLPGNKKISHKRKSKMQQSLAQYIHIDPSLFASVSASDDNNSGEAEKKEEEEEGKVKIKKEDNSSNIISDIDAVRKQLDDDEVLFPLLKDEDNKVDFVFKTTSPTTS